MPSEIGIQNILSLLLVETVNVVYVTQAGRHVNFSGQKICMYVCGYPTDPAKKYRSYTFLEDLFRNFYVSLGTATSRIFLQKIQRFANSVPFNMTEMV